MAFSWRNVLLAITLPLAAAGILVPLILALFGSENLLMIVIKDDGFYFLTLARNLAHGHGATFDRLGPTNGFHPLWAFVLTPIFWFPYASVYTPARIAILVATLLHALGGAAVYRAARALTDREAARLAALFFVANPLGVYLVVSGMESPLVSVLLAALAAESLRLRQGTIGSAGPVSRSRIVAIGILGGLCILARTDSIILLGFVLTSALLLVTDETDRPFAVRIRRTLFVGLLSSAVVAPWIIWNLVRFGTVVQVSARAHHLHSVTERALAGTSASTQSWTLGPAVVRGVLKLTSQRTHLHVSVILPILLAALGIGIGWAGSLLRRQKMRSDLFARLRCLDAPILYAVGFLFACFFFLGHIRSWYMGGPLAVAGIVMAIPAFYATRGELAGRFARALSALVFAGLTIGLLPLWFIFGNEVAIANKEMHPWREASAWVLQHTKPEDRLGSFGTGAFAFLTSRTVVNLDGVINNRVIDWLERRQMASYLRHEKIRYVIDSPHFAPFYLNAYGEPGWKDIVVPIDTLRSNLIVYEVR